VVQLESVFLATYFKEIRRQRKAILAIRLHNIEYRIWKGLAEESRHLFKKYYLQNLATRMKRFEQNAWQEADVIIPITQRDAEIAKANISRTKIMVAPFGMNEKIVKSNVEEQWNAYHIGAMDWAPNAEGIRWLIEEAWKDIHDAVPELQFHFAGRNMPVDFKNYEDNGVVCEGEVADANTFIANKKILLVPLFAAGGIRVKVLEGMAAGKLVIATPTAMQGIDEAVSGKHFLLATNAEEFKQQILWTLHHKEEATQIAEQGKKLVEEYYNQEKIMKKLSDFLLQQINTSTTHL
jgi:glycosyltransferase involved in cell wall biosynthesis